MINHFEYSLPDIELLKKESNQYLIWIPDKVYIVLGASNNALNSLRIDNVVEDKITVMRRPSGGQTVILTPNNIIISAVYFNYIKHPKEVFQHINKLIISVIEEIGIPNLAQMGISDIAISGKKILGSAIYRKKNVLLYHAVLNLGEPTSTFEKYLMHPTKEPDYRKGRSHSEFVTSLKEKGYAKDYHHLQKALTLSFESLFNSL